jgi:hypothetical protein
MGSFNAGKKHGVGRETTESFVYDGTFENNRKERHGKLTLFGDSLQYEGQFEADQPNGKGMVKWKGKDLEGVWERGKLVAITNYEI